MYYVGKKRVVADGAVSHLQEYSNLLGWHEQQLRDYLEDIKMLRNFVAHMGYLGTGSPSMAEVQAEAASAVANLHGIGATWHLLGQARSNSKRQAAGGFTKQNAVALLEQLLQEVTGLDSWTRDCPE